MKDQLIMSGVLTEADIVRDYMRRLGSKGGSVGSPKQKDQRRRAIAAARKAKKGKSL